MDVTCERCSTAYEFDDALVSERGTTVKCTNCGHQFKVRRPQPAGAPERWLVRTIDGRELEFRALRELQAAIAQAVITRDDVLSRGGSRPRRLGSIAELEPFFVSAGAGGPTHATSLGLGPRAPIITGHPSVDGAGHIGGDPRTPAGRGRAPSPSSTGQAPAVAMPPGTERARVTTAQGIGNVPPARTSEVSIAIPLPRGPEPEPAAAGHAGGARRPISAPPPPRRSTPPPPPGGGLPGVIVGAAGAPPLPTINEDALYDDTTRAVPSRARQAEPSYAGAAAEDRRAAPPRAPAEDRRAAPPRAPAPEPRRPASQTVDDVSGPTKPFEIGTLLDPVRVRAAAQEDWTADASVDDVSVPVEPDGEDPPQNQHTASVPPLTPTPAAVRHSYADDLLEPRFSQAAAPPPRAGAVRWIVGMVVVGMLALAFATVGRKMLVSGATPKPVEGDARIGALLADGEKSLADGDFESAKEQFDKASVLGERDPRAVADLARLAAAKGDLEWLRVRLLPDADPEQATAKRELDQAAQRARKVADHAGELAPADPAVLRSRIDALRLAGDLAGARKLVGGISAASGQPDNALTLAELDLAEQKPDWPTVLGRLRAALSTDGNLGRARSMLVFALARSGDAAGARAELEHLGALPRSRPHPLLGPLRTFLGRGTLDPNGLPDASAKPAAGKSGYIGGDPRTPGPAGLGPKKDKDRERPTPTEPHEPRPTPTPGEHVTPSGEPIDTSDLPGVKAPTPPKTSTPATPAPPTTAPPSTIPPGVDTSDLPGFK